MDRFQTKKSKQEAKILIVEDNRINIKVITLLLQECGIEDIVVARTGKEAITVLSEKFDLIFLDLGLPDMHGTKLFEVLRKKSGKKLIPIVVCTADQTSKEICTEIGVDDIIMKPITLNIVKQVISRWLS